MGEWQPAVIAPEAVQRSLPCRCVVEGPYVELTNFIGKVVHVRESKHARAECWVDLHPDDAEHLFGAPPNSDWGICRNCLLMD
jgi:hypothetical protein